MADGKLLEEGTPEEIFEHPQHARLQEFLVEGFIRNTMRVPGFSRRLLR